MPHLWNTLPRPLIGLSPMDGMTDHPYRHIQKRYGNPDLIFTEFVRVERLIAGEMKLLRELLYDESQRPIVAQVYGTAPDAFRGVAVLLCRLGFDGIDINMGCPSNSVAENGAGAGLIRTPALAAEIIAAARAGVYDWQKGATAWDVPGLAPALADRVEQSHARLPAQYRQPRDVPVSVKTRIGYDHPQVDEWIPHLLDCAPAAISLHGRTLAQAYSGSADWSAIGRTVELARGSGTLILGNGDVADRADALARADAYGVDGVLIGRASYGNPFVFCAHTANPTASGPFVAERYRRLSIAREHLLLFEKSLSTWPGYAFQRMHKHLSCYARQMPGARGLRRALLQTVDAAGAIQALDAYLAYRDHK
ncbi:MAG: tRNA-dihydrouridine synthase [Caldilineaceae bacterium]|nr:tRNA-dihydrouridine synthase [Caldilineaceae bacterium]